MCVCVCMYVCDSTMTIEKQRTVAKELVNYFNDRQYEQEYLASRVFGWTINAEITNGRWVMFGLLVRARGWACVCVCVCVCDRGGCSRVYERRQRSLHDRIDPFLRPLAVCKKRGRRWGLDVRVRSEFPEYQTHQL